MKHNLKILISGSGIGGLNAAYWLHHYGFEFDIIEKTTEEKCRRGYIIDFWGPGFEIAKKMGILPTLEKKSLHYNNFIFKAEKQENSSQFGIKNIRPLLQSKFLTLPHYDLSQTILNKVKKFCSIKYETTISNIEFINNKSIVTFNDQTKKNYDLIIAADGIHSQLRKICFNNEEFFKHDLGFQLAVFEQEVNPSQVNYDITTYAIPNKQVTYFKAPNDKLITCYCYRIKDREIRNAESAILSEYKNFPWQTQAPKDDKANLVFDRLTQIKMPIWHKNNVVFIGDSCGCMTILAGQGASVAMADSYVLSLYLNKHHDDFATAFSKYQNLMQPHVLQKQLLSENFLHQYIPDDEAGITRRSYFLRKFLRNMYQIVLDLPV